MKRYHQLSHISGDWKSEIQVLAGVVLVPSEGCEGISVPYPPLASGGCWWFLIFLGCRSIALISDFISIWHSVCVGYVQMSPFYKNTSHIGLGPSLNGIILTISPMILFLRKFTFLGPGSYDFNMCIWKVGSSTIQPMTLFVGCFPLVGMGIIKPYKGLLSHNVL
jgi:hypothetical protein